MINTKLSFVLVLVDDYTGRIISQASAAKVTVADAPVTSAQTVKRDGYRVFTGLSGHLFSIRIISPYYGEQNLILDTKTLNPSEPVVFIRLYPNERFKPTGIQMTAIQMRATDKEGLGISGQKIGVALNGNLKYRLLENVDCGSETVRLFCPDKSGLWGRELLLISRKKESPAIARMMLTQQGTDEYEYLLSKPLTASFQTDAEVLVYYEMQSDCQGNVYLPINLRNGACDSVTLLYPGADGKIDHEHKITTGISNQLPDGIVDADKKKGKKQAVSLWAGVYAIG